ncbi:MAG: histidine phosphatase family protein [Mariprofundaceae bacterium]|nr:histidine phosphatase family protein [Mariprofundaceae bacterium]
MSLATHTASEQYAGMERHLLLIRHAKSDWSDPALSDFERPLNTRGQADALFMAQRLAAANVKIRRMYCSPAERARSTAEQIAQVAGFPSTNIDWMTELYLANPLTMLEVIHACPDDVDTIALVGHNPGISALASHLCGDMHRNIPTCGMVHLSADIEHWRDASSFQLSDFDYPKRDI